jgi:hypothetical protein
MLPKAYAQQQQQITNNNALTQPQLLPKAEEHK